MNDLDHVNDRYLVSLLDTHSVGITNADFGAGGDSVVFDRYGRPDNGGTVVVRIGGEQRTITVNAVTGQVDIS